MAVCFAVAEPQNIVFSLAVDSVSIQQQLSKQRFQLLVYMKYLMVGKRWVLQDVHPKDGVFTKLDDKETTSSRCISEPKPTPGSEICHTQIACSHCRCLHEKGRKSRVYA